MKKLLVLLAVLCFPLTAHAQFGPFGPGGVIASSQGFGQRSVTTPTGAAQTLLTQNIGIGAFSSPLSFHGRGYISGQVASPGTLTLTVTMGAGTAQTVLNAITIEVSGVNGKVPFTLDCDWNQINTGTTPIGLGGQTLNLAQQCQMSWIAAGSTTLKTYPPGSTVATANPITPAPGLTTNPALVISVTFSDTSFGTGIVMQDWRIVQGF